MSYYSQFGKEKVVLCWGCGVSPAVKLWGLVQERLCQECFGKKEKQALDDVVQHRDTVLAQDIKYNFEVSRQYRNDAKLSFRLGVAFLAMLVFLHFVKLEWWVELPLAIAVALIIYGDGKA